MLTRWNLSSSLDRERGAPDWAIRHAGACDECRRFWDRLRALDAELASSRAEALPPARLASPRPFPAPRWLLLSSLAAAALLGAILWSQGGEPADRAVAPAKLAPAEARSPAAPPAPFSGGSELGGRALISRAARGLEKLPALNLEREVHRLKADARSGVEHVLRVGGLR